MSLREKILDVLAESYYNDYFWNGEDEYPYSVFDESIAATKIIDLLEKEGYLIDNS